MDAIGLTIVAGTFILAGGVKGVIGLGLPTVSLAILTIAFDLTTAMALLLVPSFVTNVWQALVGGEALNVIKRLWWFFTIATATIWIGSLALPAVDHQWLSALLGLSLIIYATIALSGAKLDLPKQHQTWAGGVAAVVNGILAGMTGSFVVPGVMYLQSIGLARTALIQAMGMLFTVSTAALAVVLGNHGLLNADLGTVSLAALLPAIGGMVIGQKIRARLSDATFRRVFFVSVFIVGLYIIGSTLLRG